MPAQLAEGNAPSLADQGIHKARYVNQAGATESHLLGLIEDAFQTVRAAYQGVRENNRPPQNRLWICSTSNDVEVKPDAPNVALGEAGASVNGAEVEEANVACNETHLPNGGMTVHVLDGARPLDDPDPEEARSVGFLWIVYADVAVELLRGVANFDEPHLDDREAGAHSSSNCALEPFDEFLLHGAEHSALLVRDG